LRSRSGRGVHLQTVFSDLGRDDISLPLSLLPYLTPLTIQGREYG